MIPKSNLYKNTSTDMVKSMIDVNKLLSKFGIIEKRLTQGQPDNSFFEFIIRRNEASSLLIRIKIPFIQARTRNGVEYDEMRSYRYFYHYLKALLSAKEAEMYSIEEIFMAHIVMPLPNGQTITLGEQLNNQIASGHTPMLQGFEVMSAPHSNALEDKKQTLTLRKIEND